MTRTLPTGTVTLLFTDIEGSTALLEDLGPRYGDVLAGHRALLREVWAAHGGVEVDAEGDAFLVAFTGARAAAAAAEEAQRRLAAEVWPGGAQVRVRMGLHTGEPSVRDGAYWGRDVHYGARVAAAAHGGQVLLSATTAVQLPEPPAPLGDLALKDFPDPRPLFQLVVDGRGPDAFPPPRTPVRNLPPLPVSANPLIGRAAELEAVEALVRERQLVTVAGPGGTGKTRFALELARRLAPEFGDGAAFVALEELSEADAVPGLIAAALQLPERTDVPPAERVAAHVAGRALLVVLDNFEHVLDAAGLAAQLATAGPASRVVVTSQAPLRVSGETLFELGPLEVPADAEADPGALAAVPSVALLVDRARAAAPGFGLDASNAAAVAELCARLEGLPLALELAAPRLGLLDPAGLVRRLDAGLDALGTGARDAPVRQRGLRAMLDWTTGLLDEPDRAVLARLSVFAGGFTLELAEAAFGDVIEGVAALRDVGLVRRGRGGRLTLRPPVRRYAAELLAASGDEADARRAHAAAIAAFAEQWETNWSLTVLQSLPALSAEAGNIFEALAHARPADAVLHARLAAATGWWAYFAGHRLHGLEHVRAALAATTDARLRARLLEAFAVQVLVTEAPEAGERAVEAWRAVGDPRRLLATHVWAANMHHHAASPAARMLAHTTAARAIAGELGDPELIAMAELAHAQAVGVDGRYEEARELVTVARARLPAGSYMHFWAATERADLELDHGHPADALPYYGQALEALSALPGLVLGKVMQVDSIALALARLGRREEAATALAIARLGHHELSTPPFGGLAAQLDEAHDLLDAAERAAGEARARTLGLRPGLDWAAGVALGALAAST